MNIKWNEDKTQATLTKADLEALQANSQNNFDKGYGKGAESGRKEMLQNFAPLGINGDDLDGSISKIKETLEKFEKGQIPPEKLQESDVVKNLTSKLEDLKQQLEQKNGAYQTLESNFDTFKEETLVDSALSALASKHKALPEMDKKVAALFKMDYSIEVGDGNKLIIKQPNGNRLFDESGSEAGLDYAFSQFAAANKPFFSANGQSGGSGGNGNGVPSGISRKDLKTPESKAAFVAEHGFEAYQKMVVADNK